MSKLIRLETGTTIDVISPFWRAPARVYEVERDLIVTSRPDGVADDALQPGSLVTLRLVVTEPPYEGEYLAESRFAGVTADPAPGWLFENPSSWIRNQKRSYARVDVDLPCRCRIGSSRWLPARVVNLSAGGFAFEWEGDVEEGAPVSAVISLPSKPIKVHGTAVRTFALSESEKVGKIGVGVRITRIDERDRDRVVQFVFQKQVELRRRGRV